MKFGRVSGPFLNADEWVESVTIGEFTIHQISDGVVWIERGDEDAMTASEEGLSCAIKLFYNKNF